ncbi:glycosyltransferase [Paraburkholderia sp. SIMBA_049]
MNELPMVSVMVITYNHANFIAQALQSILDQKVDFSVEINVIDDCSTDGTREIIGDFKARYPSKINLFLNKKNIGFKVTQKNFYRGFKTLNGKYIAILEGDDYWTSSDKLQGQVDFLERNPDFVACAHNVLKIYDNSDVVPHIFLEPPNKEVHDISDLINLSSYFHTSSLTYRNVLRSNIPRQFRNKLSCDLFITMAHAQYGKIRFVPDVMSVYRCHQGGRFSGMPEAEGWIFNIDGYRKYNAWLKYKYFSIFCGAIYRYCEYLLRHGKEEDGLTRWRRGKYKAIMIFYRALSEYVEQRSLSVFLPKRLFR